MDIVTNVINSGSNMTGTTTTNTLTVTAGGWKFCPNCGHKLETGWRFCSECGNSLAGQYFYWYYPVTYPTTYPLYPQPIWQYTVGGGIGGSITCGSTPSNGGYTVSN